MLQNRLEKGARRPYLHAGGTQHTPPVPVQAEHKGIGQAVQRRRQDVQQGQGEGGILRVEGIMEPVGQKKVGRRHRGRGRRRVHLFKKKRREKSFKKKKRSFRDEQPREGFKGVKRRRRGRKGEFGVGEGGLIDGATRRGRERGRGQVSDRVRDRVRSRGNESGAGEGWGRGGGGRLGEAGGGGEEGRAGFISAFKRPLGSARWPG